MRLVTTVLLGLVLNTLAISECKKLQPTLHGYRVQQYGESYVQGRIVLPSIPDGEVCEKLRQDLRVFSCRYSSAQGVTGNHHVRRLTRVGPTGIPELVEKAQRMRANQIGGEKSKQRQIQGAWKLFREQQAKREKALLAMAAAKPLYIATFSKLKSGKCRIFGSVIEELVSKQ